MLDDGYVGVVWASCHVNGAKNLTRNDVLVLEGIIVVDAGVDVVVGVGGIIYWKVC